MQPSAHATAQREIRVFLSSTFRDMEHEREYLMSRVFPSFRKLCLQREVVFTEIDLRWGITQESANNGRTVQICLEEIDRCRSLQLPPFFIGFLGERYGWIPTSQELQHYWAQFPDSAYAPQIQAALAQGISVTELEVRFGFLDQAPTQAASRVLMLLRDASLTARMAQSAPTPGDFLEPALQPRLEQLKAAVRQGEREGKTALVDGYQSLEAFGEAIHAFLVEQLDALFPLQEVPDPLMQQQRLHDGYAASRLRNHVPTPRLSEGLLERLTQPEAPICIWVQGPSGSGKSAFLADFARRLHTEHEVLVLQHFLAADTDQHLTQWRDRVLHTLQAQGWVRHDLPETEYQRWQALPAWLSEVAQHLDRRILLVLDALDQATDTSVVVPLLSQLPWGPEVRLLVSATPTLEVPPLWHVFPMPALGPQDRLHFARTYLHHFAKQLPEDLLQRIVQAGVCETPLFLRTVLEETRMRSRHATLEQDLAHWLSQPDTGALFLSTLEALDQDYASQGAALASRAARYLAASRQGLTQHTLAEMLAPNGQPRLPDRILLPLLANLQPYVLQNEGRMQLQHALLVEAIEQDRDAMWQARQELLAQHAGDDARVMTEAAYQRVRLQLTTIENDLRGGIADPSSPLQTFEDYLLHDYQQKFTFLESLKNLPAFVKVWEVHSDVSYNHLQLIGAGKAWQPADHQDALLAHWMESLQALDATALLALDLDRLTLWFDQQAMVYLCREYAQRVLQLKLQRMAAHPQELALSATLAAQMLLEHGHDLPAEHTRIRQWLEQARHWEQQAGAKADTSLDRCDLQMLTLLQQARLHYRQEQLPQALQSIHEALTLQQSQNEGALTLRTCQLLDLRALIRADQGEFGPALADAELARRARVELQGPVHRDVALSLYTLGHVRALEDHLEEAEALLERCCVMTRQTQPEFHPHLGRALHRLAEVRQMQGQDEEAVALYEEAQQCWQQHLPPSDPRRHATFLQLAQLQGQRGHLEEEQSLLKHLLVYLRCPLPDSQPPSDAGVLTEAQARLRMAELQAGQGHAQEAQKEWLLALQQLRRRALEAQLQPLVDRVRAAVWPLRVSFARPGYASRQLTGVFIEIPASLQPQPAHRHAAR